MSQFSGTATSTHAAVAAVTTLFADPAKAVVRTAAVTGEPAPITPRAAYQEALYGRTVLLDVRDAGERAAQGEPPAYLDVITAEPVGLPAIRPLVRRRRVAVLTVDGTVPEPLRTALAELTSNVQVVSGGAAGWRVAGLPRR